MDTRRRFLSSGSLLLPGWATAQPKAEPATTGPLLLANTVYPPLVNPQGHASGEGVDVDIAREALRRGGWRDGIEVQWVPWKRVLFMLERGLADFTTTVNHSAERDRFLRWSTSYRAGKHYHFYTRRGAGVKLDKLQDLRGLRLAVGSGYIYPQPVLDEVEGRVEHARDVGSAVQLVEHQRADVVIVTALVGLWEIRQLGLADRLERQPLQYFNPEPTYMGFAKASPRAAAGLAAMDAGLASMLRDGSIGRIEKRYVR
ncbi:substrate-binding periplasmic protein [Roseateles puraquae]|jgi:polar amino acid transport system substrate-binding protein|uniref:substrate-binding periplasmic protein n=1 Tax=Roseateles puraquae TaxID=431059 RepID=UPI0031DE88F9